MDGHFDLGAVAREVFINGVIQNLEDTVVKTAFIGVSDIHPGTLADGLQTFEFINLTGVVFLLVSNLGMGFFRLVWDL